jgi:hypothetical protein
VIPLNICDKAGRIILKDVDITIPGSLRNAPLAHADLSNLRGAGLDLQGAELVCADLTDADLTGANLCGANLYRADLLVATLQDADLRGAHLTSANLLSADLRGANLHGTRMNEAKLTKANFSGATGLLDPVEWLSANFESDADGLLVWKRLGYGNTEFAPPAHWSITAGAVLTETVNPDRTCDCTCGVNFGTLAWCRDHYRGAALWRCHIAWKDLAGVVVPYNTDGKARCSRLTLLECVSHP